MRSNWLALIVLFSVSAAAQTAPLTEDKFSAASLKLADQAYVSGWFIDPGPVALSSQPYKGGQNILKTPFFPYKSYALDAELIFGGPTDRLASGTKLVGFIAHHPTACTPKAVSRTASQALLLRRGTNRLCLNDSDNDGAFDRKFFVDNAGTMVAHQALVPKDAVAIPPVKYHETDRVKSPVSGSFSLFYYSHHSLVKEFSIGFGYVRDDGSNPNTGGITAYSFKDKDVPLSVKLFGGAYRIEKMEKGRITVLSEGTQPLTPIYLGTNCCI